MGSKNKRKSQKRAKEKDKHGRRCKCDECSEKRAGRKWNKRRVTIAREYADEKKRMKEERAKGVGLPGFLAGGHPNLKRDFTFESGDWTEPMSTLHSQARTLISKTFHSNGKLKTDMVNETPFAGRTYSYSIMGDLRLIRAYQMTLDTTKFDAIDAATHFFWHGTKIKSVSSIGHNSLEVRGSYCLLGAGIYLAPGFNKAWGYSGWSGEFRTVLLCAAKPGKTLDTKECVRHADDCTKEKNIRQWVYGKCSKECKWVKPNATTVQAMGYDSASANAGRHPGAWGGHMLHGEVCCYQAERVLPLYALVFAKERV